MYVEDAARTAVRLLKETQGYDDRAVVEFARQVLNIVGYYPVKMSKKKGE